jgi:hypothetical protein
MYGEENKSRDEIWTAKWSTGGVNAFCYLMVLMSLKFASQLDLHLQVVPASSRREEGSFRRVQAEGATKAVHCGRQGEDEAGASRRTHQGEGMRWEGEEAAGRLLQDDGLWELTSC